MDAKEAREITNQVIDRYKIAGCIKRIDKEIKEKANEGADFLTIAFNDLKYRPIMEIEIKNIEKYYRGKGYKFENSAPVFTISW